LVDHQTLLGLDTDDSPIGLASQLEIDSGEGYIHTEDKSVMKQTACDQYRATDDAESFHNPPPRRTND
jgi:hypothetical protein